ncbi:hypothetical protein HNO92_002434 [Chromobacterium alkanivorans]|uniref:hypothetical protein n=3 Tax=Chromobacterium alkanivorans TaxID=1071719 RepID=UPI002169B1FB|nr:hypothetical protein [Chromobacterium alkanivorans]MCS3805571.1 hypothetical protein [Chromobacterium alkanivorans]MCS3819910.1 hypothetical protein [Chromobacterium alkanivorans]MCS3874115.1 hypothetical protein [Chromobacterium alkanivorans]
MQHPQNFPRRRRYKLHSLEQQEALLPFVRFCPGRTYAHYWQMPMPSKDAPADAAYGRECAAHLLQWLKDNREYVGKGLLSRVARDIDFDDRDGRGQWMGFFNYLEIIMLLGADRVRVYRHVDSQHQIYLALGQRFNLEARFRRIRLRNR